MKDKLYKHHKKPSYFLLRNIFLIVLTLSFSAAAIVVPVTVSINVSKSNIVLVK